MSKIATALEILSDGKWHEIRELLTRLELDNHKLQGLTSFLNVYNFVIVDERKRRIKISNDFKNLLTSAAT